MTGIVEFLTARMDEDEAIARAVVDFHSDGGYDWVDVHTDLDPDAMGFNAFDPDPAAYLRRFTPSWVLADIAAKRAIIKTHKRNPLADLPDDDPQRDYYNADEICVECMEDAPCRTVRLLASVHADHADYQQEWVTRL